jgi:FkbM family methyltransferase
MCAAAVAEFRSYIDSNQLTILNCGIAEQAGKLEFWICNDVTQWSSFNRELASRNGSKHDNVQVDCIPIQDIIGRFGVPDYMKIDIESNDLYCLNGLTEDTVPGTSRSRCTTMGAISTPPFSAQRPLRSTETPTGSSTVRSDIGPSLCQGQVFPAFLRRQVHAAPRRAATASAPRPVARCPPA